MRKWFRILLSLIVLAASLATAVYWFGLPQVELTSPVDGSAAAEANTSIRLTFSRAMNTDTVVERLVIEPDTPVDMRWDENTLEISPIQPWKAGTLVQIRLAAGSKAAGWISLPVQSDSAWSFTVRQVFLAYLYPANAPANIYLVNPETNTRLQITDHPKGIQDYAVSKDGKAIYFSAANEQGGSNLYSLMLDLEEIMQTIMDGGKPASALVLECAEATCKAPALSPVGDNLAFERTEAKGFPQVWYLSLPQTPGDAEPAGDGELSQPLLAADPSHQTLLPTWSPEGLLTYYDTQEEAFVTLDLTNNQRFEFPNQTGQQGGWRANGREFVAAEINFLDTGTVNELPNFANSHLILYHLLNGSRLDLTPGENMEDSFPVFSPDGIYLAFARKYLDKQRWTPGRQLWLMMPGVGNAQPITDEPEYTHFDFAWNGKGDQLAYVRFNQAALTALPEIWVLNLLNAERGLLVEGGYLPQWLP